MGEVRGRFLALGEAAGGERQGIGEEQEGQKEGASVGHDVVGVGDSVGVGILWANVPRNMGYLPASVFLPSRRCLAWRAEEAVSPSVPSSFLLLPACPVPGTRIPPVRILHGLRPLSPWRMRGGEWGFGASAASPYFPCGACAERVAGCPHPLQLPRPRPLRGTRLLHVQRICGGGTPAQVASSVLWPVAPLACGRRLGGAAETPPPASLRARYVSRGRAEEVTDSAGDYASLSARYVSRGHYTPPGSPEKLFLACALRPRGKPP